MLASLKLRFCLTIVLCFGIQSTLFSQAFITTWQTDNSGPSEDNQITIPTFSGETYSYDVDWGDGTNDINVTGDITHTYSTPGTYSVSISGDFPRIYFDAGGFFGSDTDHDKILSVEQWGNINWASMASAFSGCSNLRVNATDTPDLSSVTDMSEMFLEAESLNDNIDNWDVSTIITMRSLFEDAIAFNQPLNSWDVGNVTNMAEMFSDAEVFDQPLNSWNVSSVTTMEEMFFFARAFNQDLSTWVVDNVENMADMFTRSQFDQDISGWNVSNVTNLDGTFQSTPFNQDISGWNVSNVTIMRNLFRGAELFNQDVSTWNVSNVTNMFGMFNGAIAFDQDISGWDVDQVSNMSTMFSGANAFTADITGWDVSGATNLSGMFQNNTTFNQDISGWIVSGVSNMEDMFSGATAFNMDISSWMVDNVDDMSGMFSGATSFNQDITGWNVGGVDDMRFMFSGASSFNQNLGTWDVTALRFAVNMFDNSGISIENYDNILVGWNSQAVRTGVSFGASNIFYCSGVTARAELISNNSWFILDGGQGCITAYDGIDTSTPQVTNGQAAPIDFGSIDITPSFKTRSITIRNELATPLTNLLATISGTAFTIPSPPPSSILAGATETFDIVFSDLTPGSYAETLTITSDQFTGFTFDLIGIITAVPEPEIAVFEGATVLGNEIIDDQTSAFYFGDDLRGNTLTQEITLFNKGSAPLIISDITISGTVFSFGSATPGSVPADGTQTIQILLNSSVAGIFTETLTITNNDGDEAIFNFDLEGQFIGPDIAVFEGPSVSFSNEIFDSQPTAIDLGSSPFGNDIVQEITVGNLNPQILNISDISISGSAFSSDAVTPFTVAPEVDGVITSLTFNLILSGSTAGIFNETVVINTDDDDEPFFTFPVTGQIGSGFPEIAFFTSSGTEIFDGQVALVDFGSQIQGSGINETFSIENQGTSDLTITDISISGTSFIINSALSFPLVIGAGGSELLDIFLPGSSVGSFTATVSTLSDDSDESLFDFAISGEILAAPSPEIAVFEIAPFNEILNGQTTSISFGTENQGTNITKQFDIENQGTDDLVISNISVSGSSYALSNPAPTVLAAGSTQRIDITLSGDAVGIFTETITISSNDVDEAEFEFTLTGEITSVNSSPTISAINDVTIDEDGNTGEIPFTINDAESSPDNLIVTATSTNDTLTPASNIVLGGASGSRTIIITPENNANGASQITVHVDDGEAIVSESFSLSVNPVNDAPIITGQSTLTTPQNTSITLQLSNFSVSDIDNTFPDGFSLVVNGGNNYTTDGDTVAPDPDFVGDLTVPIVISDGEDSSPIFDVVVTVEEGELEVDLGGAPLASGSVVDFDDIPVGAEDSRELIVTNTGTIPLVITEIIIEGDDFTLASGIPEPIEPGGSTILLISFRPTSIGQKSATLTIRSQSAADFTAQLNARGLSEAPPIEIFNVVTTAQNGKHDFLEIRNIEFYDTNRVYIYSRWGNEVYKTENYNNTDNRFIGDSDGGDELPEGTYYYVIELNGGETVENGFFLLRR